SAIDADEAGARGPEAAPPSSLDRVALAERAERAGGAPAAAAGAREETGAERIRRWQARLLDLSLRNRLINFRRTGRTIGVAAPDVAAVEDRLADQQSFTLHPRTEGDEAFLRAQAAAGHLYTDEAAAEMQKRLLLLYRTRNAVIDETGANPLYLALGMLRWYETAASETARYAPLILLPVRLERRSAGERYRYELAL